MRHLYTVVASLSLFAVLAVTPVFATDARQAMVLCDKNPGCNYRTNSDGSVSIDVGGSMIECPQEGQCICLFCPTSTPGRAVNMNSQILSQVMVRPLPAPTRLDTPVAPLESISK